LTSPSDGISYFNSRLISTPIILFGLVVCAYFVGISDLGARFPFFLANSLDAAFRTTERSAPMRALFAIIGWRHQSNVSICSGVTPTMPFFLHGGVDGFRQDFNANITVGRLQAINSLPKIDNVRHLPRPSRKAKQIATIALPFGVPVSSTPPRSVTAAIASSTIFMSA
jgi:hypothetical protein